MSEINDPTDVPCCCDCGIELNSNIAERNVTEKEPWSLNDPFAPQVVELICYGCAVNDLLDKEI